jgi:hypothetical protein
VFQIFQPGFELETGRRRRADAGRAEGFTEADLYPDVRACLVELKAAGFLVGVAGNQAARAGQIPAPARSAHPHVAHPYRRAHRPAASDRSLQRIDDLLKK